MLLLLTVLKRSDIEAYVILGQEIFVSSITPKILVDLDKIS